jgi:hypothetical protein
MLLANTCYDATNELSLAVAKTIAHSHSIENLCAVIDAMFALADTAASLGRASSFSVLSEAEIANHNVMMALLHQIHEHTSDAEKAANRLALIARFNPRLNKAIKAVYELLQEFYDEDEMPFVYEGIQQLYERITP